MVLRGSQAAVADAVARHLSGDPGRILSLDIFDTLLLRRCQPELVRLMAVSRAQAQELRRAGIAVTARAVSRARLACQKQAYDDARAGCGPDPGYADIIGPLCRSLGLPADTGALLLEAEIAWDLAHVRANRRLLSALAAATDRLPHPPTIIAVSDMYLPEAAVRRLVGTHVPQLAGMAIFVSCEAGASKHRGDVYPLVADALELEGSAILHIGDQVEADGRRASAAGWQSLVLPRPRLCRVTTALQDRAVRRILRHRPALLRAPLRTYSD